MPASRNARAMILAPRSWPSRPGLATTTRILAVVDDADMDRRAGILVPVVAGAAPPPQTGPRRAPPERRRERARRCSLAADAHRHLHPRRMDFAQEAVRARAGERLRDAPAVAGADGESPRTA